LKIGTVNIKYGGSYNKQFFEFEYQVQENSFQVETICGKLSIRVQYRTDAPSIKGQNECTLVIQPSKSCITVNCHKQNEPTKASPPLSVREKLIKLNIRSPPDQIGHINPLHRSSSAVSNSGLVGSGSPPIGNLLRGGSLDKASITSNYLSPTELLGPFAGSFEESLLSGHLSKTSFTIFQDFMADIGVTGKEDGKLKIYDHIKLPFEAIYYHIDRNTPYVGTAMFDKKGYRIPVKGVIQITLFNPSKTPIKTFLIQYDLSDMPAEHKTFMRQKITTSSHPPILHYAVHLRFSCPKQRFYYLSKEIKFIFPHRVPDDGTELRITYDTPQDPKYYPY